ncbi:MAG: caspase family protein, partial [Elsteraceae bacterium]
TIGTVAAPSAPPAASAGLAVTDWRNRADPKIGGRRVALEPEELSRATASTADRRFALIGTDYALRVLRPDASEASQARLPSAAWGVAVSADGRMAAAALGDGTLRWFALSPEGRLAERLALYPTSDGARWIAWTPEGFFDHADGGGKEFVGYQLNRAKGQAPDWFSFAQVYRLFYAPDLVAQRLRGQGAEEARTRLASIGDLRQRLEKVGPPRVELVALCWREEGNEKCSDLGSAPVVTRSAARGAAPEVAFHFVTAEQGADVQLPAGVTSAEIRFKLIEQNAEAGPVDAFLNNRNVGRSIKRRSTQAADGVQSLPVPVDSGLSRLELRAYDQAAQAYSRSRLIRIAAPVAPKAAPQKPKLYVLAVGINAYARAIGPLNFAVPDAKSFADTVREGAGGLFRGVEVIELYDEDARAQAVLSAMERIGAAANPEDTVLIYLSGHGVVMDQRYYFVTHNVATPKAIPTDAFSEAMLIRGMAGIRAKNGMMFLDTCHAGAFTLDSASQLAHESGRYVLAAASSVEEALDSYDNKNGVFATAVLRGLRGAGSRPGGKAVNNFELGFFVTPEVKQLAAEKKHRQSARFKIAADDAQPFPIVELKN